jgi:formate hydrogenlyase subunit 6/NADH:ubiquinone oxidoreductase subunit I
MLGTQVRNLRSRWTLKEIIMAYQITDKCVACGLCKDACPVEAISEGAPLFTIDADKCIDCGACAGECPNEAIIAG